LLQIPSGDGLQKVDILNLSLIKLLQNQQRCNFYASQYTITSWIFLPFLMQHYASNSRV